MKLLTIAHVKSLKAAKKLENNYLQDAKAGSTVTISKEISANKRQPAELVKA